MRLTTPVELPKRDFNITYNSQMMVLGSCFAENIGRRLAACKFRADINPFGILYNPLSIATALKRIVSGELFNEESPEFVFHGERWHSMLHHGDFSRREKADAINAINERLSAAHSAMKNLSILTLTFGTAYVYKRKCDGTVVGNCHKMPASDFIRSLLTVDEAVEALAPLLEELCTAQPGLKIVLTVSPIRHLRDGAHGNQVSKATLLLAVEELCRRLPGRVFYFPAYEIVLDELRDYRFYDEDMTHPSSLAADYIWECFKNSYFDEATNSLSMQMEEIARALAHRPFDADSKAHIEFKRKLLLKIEDFKEKYPYFDFSKEIQKLS